MAKQPRRNQSSTFKGKVALAAIKDNKTLVELSEPGRRRPKFFLRTVLRKERIRNIYGSSCVTGVAVLKK